MLTAKSNIGWSNNGHRVRIQKQHSFADVLMQPKSPKFIKVKDEAVSKPPLFPRPSTEFIKKERESRDSQCMNEIVRNL